MTIQKPDSLRGSALSNQYRALEDAAEQALLPGLEKGPATAVPGNQDRDFWLTAIRGALTQRSSRSLAIAEQGLKAYPTDPELLLQAALTAIASGKPERSLALLKRYGKRYVPNRPVALLTALALGDQEQYTIWPRPNSRVTRGHLGSVDGQPCVHVEFEAAVRVHVLPDQRRQGAEISGG